jgi:hypothetical protein
VKAMIDVGRVQGSKEMAKPLIVGKTTVYVHTDIVKLDTDNDGNPTDNLYEYNEVQYDKLEYLGLQIPYSDTKKAYIGDSEITFTNVPSGNITVYFPYEYSLEKVSDRVIISFAELEEVTDITISVL